MKQNPFDFCSNSLRRGQAMGENYLALEGMELELPVDTVAQEDAFTTLWDDDFEQDIASMTRSRRARQ